MPGKEEIIAATIVTTRLTRSLQALRPGALRAPGR
jgi:hypothetical protein